MSSIPRTVEQAYDEVDDEIVNKLDLGSCLSAYEAWLNNFKQLRESLGVELDSLSRAECLLLLEGLACSSQVLKSRLEGNDVKESIIMFARESAFLYEQFLIVHNQLKATRANQLKKILNDGEGKPETAGESALADETALASESALAGESAGTLRMNLANLLPDADDDLDTSGIYKAPKPSAISVLGGNFKSEDKIRRRQLTPSKLNRSEFVTALTEDYTNTPIIHDDGFDQLPAEDRKILKRLDDDKDDNDSDGNMSPTLRITRRTTDDLKKYKEIKKRQHMLRSGAELNDLAEFVGRITNEDDVPVADQSVPGHKSKAGKSKSGKSKSGKLAKTKRSKIKKKNR